jgi:hypothetical protein
LFTNRVFLSVWSCVWKNVDHRRRKSPPHRINSHVQLAQSRISTPSALPSGCMVFFWLRTRGLLAHERMRGRTKVNMFRNHKSSSSTPFVPSQWLSLLTIGLYLFLFLYSSLSISTERTAKPTTSFWMSMRLHTPPDGSRMFISAADWLSDSSHVNV